MLQLYPRLGITSCTNFGHSIRSYCDSGDGVCCFMGDTDGGLAHRAYFDKYNAEAIEFIQERMATTADV